MVDQVLCTCGGHMVPHDPLPLVCPVLVEREDPDRPGTPDSEEEE